MTNGSIMLNFDKPYYVAGEIINGTCNLAVENAVSATSLIIKWKGFERTKMHVVSTVPVHVPPGVPVQMMPGQPPMLSPQPSGMTRYEKRIENTKQEKEFFKQSIVLYNFAGGTVMPGNYSFPFSFQLPASLPGSFHFHHKEGESEYRGAILYKVKSNLDIAGTDIKQKQFICIVPPVTRMPKMVQKHAEKGFLLASGKLKLDGQIAKDVFYPGETVDVKAIVNNESSKNVSKLKVKLMRMIKIKADNVVREFTEEVNRKEYEGVKAKHNSEVTLPFQLDDKSFPSTEGGLVQCSYRLDVECDVKMAFDLEVQLPVQVYLMPSAWGQFNHIFNIPHNWYQD